MKIGVDISVLQTGHRKRGVGYTLINFVNHLPASSKKKHDFVLFMYAPDPSTPDPLPLLDLKGLDYETRIIAPAKKTTFKLPSKLRLINSILNAFYGSINSLFGDSRITNVRDLDWFLQFDQAQPLPARRKVKSSLLLYDLIQYVMSHDYLPSYRIARAKGHSLKGALRIHLRRRNYVSRLRRNARKAQSLLAISEYTKQDFVRILGVSPKKIQVCLLGVSPLLASKGSAKPGFEAFVPTSWGDLPKAVDLTKQPFLLFVGGADPRRKLKELVAAFNNIRARGYELKLVLAGDTMLGPSSVPNIELQQYLKHTSYLDDIYFVGFVNDLQRDWLYQNALAFVYPSLYEGFGLPILEAMQYKTPVITYRNSSIWEVAGNAAIYADNFEKICSAVIGLLDSPSMVSKYAKSGLAQSNKFSWQDTARKIIKSVG